MGDPLGRKVFKDGKVYYRIGDAAKILGTNAATVKELMGTGSLEWIQSRAGSKTLLVSAESVVKLKYPGTIVMRVKGHDR